MKYEPFYFMKNQYLNLIYASDLCIISSTKV